MIKISLSKNGAKYKSMYEAIVDECDADLDDLDWSVLISGNRSRYAYREQGVLMHRIILERVLGRKLSTSEQVDHIDGDGMNNRRDNLRVASNTQNRYNSAKMSNSKWSYKGIAYHGKKWRARITVNGLRINLGSFDLPEQAHAAYCKAAKRLHGEFWNDGSES